VSILLTHLLQCRGVTVNIDYEIGFCVIIGNAMLLSYIGMDYLECVTTNMSHGLFDMHIISYCFATFCLGTVTALLFYSRIITITTPAAAAAFAEFREFWAGEMGRKIWGVSSYFSHGSYDDLNDKQSSAGFAEQVILAWFCSMAFKSLEKRGCTDIEGYKEIIRAIKRSSL
jgi:hypothetical protein